MKFGICEVDGLQIPNPFNYTVTKCKGKERITEGVCSKKTERLLKKKEECAYILEAQSDLIYQKLIYLLDSMCTQESVGNLWSNLDYGSISSRLVPVDYVVELQDVTISVNLNQGMFLMEAKVYHLLSKLLR